ncbi:MAG: peptidoglycan DD-metalloendopeptidase family protein, partial [Candidatus Doudnabacteria bacterium]|nr:peptidoglycan DD-metalloendopeptidase family protein [Candidatus Doudnabacteria bacterium]
LKQSRRSDNNVGGRDSDRSVGEGNKTTIQQKIFTAIAGVLLFATVVFVFTASSFVLGQTTDELNQQRSEKQKKLNEINQRISQLQKEIKQKQSAVNTLNNQIAIMNLEIAQTEAEIESANNKIDATNLDIAETTNQIILEEQAIAKQKEILKQLIVEINDLDQTSPLEIALENDNFTEFLDRLQYAASIQEQSQESLTIIKQLKAELELRQAELKKQKDDLDTLRQQLTLTQANLQGQRQGKQEVLNETKGQERVYQRLLSESENLEEQIAREVYDLDVEISRRLGNRRLPAKKGLLAWPMDGILTQGYGNTGFTSLGYTYHNGIDIAGPAGTSIYAAADGVVLDTGTGNGAYGNWVTIKHAVGSRALVTLYAHMSSFRLRPGQAVKTGDLVGFEGNTGNTTRLLYGPHRGYHIHFTIFDFEGYGVAEGKLTKQFGSYQVPYGATYNPLDFL